MAGHGVSTGAVKAGGYLSQIWRGRIQIESFPSRAAEQALAADGATAQFLSNLFLSGLKADRAPQLKRSVSWLS